MPNSYRIGADENGLGARLGPLVVTAVLARVEPEAVRLFTRKLPKSIAELIGDSKERMSHSDVALGEAWARALSAPNLETPDAIFSALSLEGATRLRAPCPRQAERQCWSVEGEWFSADPALVQAALSVRTELSRRGLELLSVKSSVVCTERLNDALSRGKNRFVTDLHAMEALVLDHRERAGADVLAVCGKVGGMGDYSRFFGPLSGRLHAVIEQQRKRSAYHFPKLGELQFVQDADARDPLVMLASLVGKWVRELLMARIGRWYATAADDGVALPSGYHDPVTARFVERTALVRAARRVPDTCFERTKSGDG
ncbi:MAG: hypothetical protein IPI67_38335 [Myxococcales bacterium]|nr:hypothetical protein [Myxococcales bacterium]